MESTHPETCFKPIKKFKFSKSEIFSKFFDFLHLKIFLIFFFQKMDSTHLETCFKPIKKKFENFPRWRPAAILKNQKFWSDQIVEFDEVYHRTKLEVGTSFRLEGDAKTKIVDGRTEGQSSILWCHRRWPNNRPDWVWRPSMSNIAILFNGKISIAKIFFYPRHFLRCSSIIKKN